jgi:hypothetical protein
MTTALNIRAGFPLRDRPGGSWRLPRPFVLSQKLQKRPGAIPSRAHAAWRDCVHEDMGKVLAVLVQSALMPGREGHADRKVYLEMMRMYQPAASTHVEVKAEARVSSGDLSDEQLLELFRGNEQHLPSGVRRRLEEKGMVAGHEARG